MAAKTKIPQASAKKRLGTPLPLKTARYFRNASDEEEDKEKEKTDNGERGTPSEHLRSPASDNSAAQRTDKIGGHIARKRTVEIKMAEHDSNAGHDGCEHHRNQQCL